MSLNLLKKLIIITINYYIPFHENTLILGDFNMTAENLNLNNLVHTFNLGVLVKTTCSQ